MRRSLSTFLLSAILLTSLCSCDKNGNLNLLSVEDDKNLGLQTDSAIRADAAHYPLLSESAYPEAYSLVRGLKDKILASGRVKYKDDFAWKVMIINDKNTQNAFCTPGGYIYVYTGIMKYLESPDQLAGVMGHEMGHADLRHSSREITKEQGISVLSQIILGQASQSVLTQVTEQLVTLKFSRDYEREADLASVEYLGGTEYNCAGAAGFFVKIGRDTAAGSPPPEFLSTHPNPDSRVKSITDKATENGCIKADASAADYRRIVDALP